MKRLAHSLILASVLAVVLQGTALAGVQISWSDAGGAKSVPLDLVPIAVGDPLYAGFDFAWFGILDVEMDSAPIDFTASGDYIGDFDEIWYQVILYQNVTNLTECSWSEFNLDLDGAYFGPVDGAVNNWSVVQTDFKVHYYADPGPLVDPGEVFRDGITIFDPDNWMDPDPDADFVLTKYPECVPEPGSMAALFGGLVGLAAFVKRRKA